MCVSGWWVIDGEMARIVHDFPWRSIDNSGNSYGVSNVARHGCNVHQNKMFCSYWSADQQNCNMKEGEAGFWLAKLNSPDGIRKQIGVIRVFHEHTYHT
jgi:hypothetical protein